MGHVKDGMARKHEIVQKDGIASRAVCQCACAFLPCTGLHARDQDTHQDHASLYPGLSDVLTIRNLECLLEWSGWNSRSAVADPAATAPALIMEYHQPSIPKQRPSNCLLRQGTPPRPLDDLVWQVKIAVADFAWLNWNKKEKRRFNSSEVGEPNFNRVSGS